MTTAERLTKIAENEIKVYEAGQKSMIDESKIIEKTVSGKGYVCANDISELLHDVNIQLSSGTITDFSNKSVTVCGANLMPFPYRRTDGWLDVGASRKMGGCTFTVNENREIVVNGTATGFINFTFSGYTQHSFIPARYTLTGSPIGSKTTTYFLQAKAYNNSVEGKAFTEVGSGVSIDLSDEIITSISFSINIYSGITCNNVVFKPMLTFDIKGIPYEPYNAIDYTPTIDGRLSLKSISPNMSVICRDTDISMVYKKSYGMQTEYDRFWNTFQLNGERKDYVFAFGAGWKADIFKPKYPIRPVNARYFIYNSVSEYIDIPDFVTFCQENNIIIDFSNCTNAEFGLYSLRTKHLGVLDFSKCSNLNYLFGSIPLETIDNFISSPTTGYKATTFEWLTGLKNISFSGTIATAIDFRKSPLSKASIISAINALSTTTSGLPATFSKTAKEAAFTADEWAALIATKTNWTISLV